MESISHLLERLEEGDVKSLSIESVGFIQGRGKYRHAMDDIDIDVELFITLLKGQLKKYKGDNQDDN